MKTKMKVKLTALVAAMLLFAFTSQAQIPATYAYNYLACDVTIFYEMHHTGSCAPACSGSLVVPANTAAGVLIPDCTASGYDDVCIIILDIGGCNVNGTNHSSNNICCTITPFGQSGNTCAGYCGGPGIPWSANQTTGSWIIQ